MTNFRSGTVLFSWLAYDVNPAGSVTNWNPAAIVLNTSQVTNASQACSARLRAWLVV